MAAPFVAGLLGVLRALDPDLSAENAYEILKRTGRDGPDSGKVGRTIDAAAAVEVIGNRQSAIGNQQSAISNQALVHHSSAGAKRDQ